MRNIFVNTVNMRVFENETGTYVRVEDVVALLDAISFNSVEARATTRLRISHVADNLLRAAKLRRVKQ